MYTRLYTPVLLYKSGFKGVNIIQACFRDEIHFRREVRKHDIFIKS